MSMRLSSKRVVARSLFWCSAVCLLAACGGSTVHRAHDPFAYTPGSLAERDEGIVMSSKAVAVHTLSFAGANGSRVLAFLLVPRTPGKHAAVLFLHGSGGTREDLLLPAAQLAARGAVTMTISQPNDAVRSGRSS